MWFESQNCAMMGLQATPAKRKLEAATTPGDSTPPKTGRWEADDCIARLQAVAVPSDTWRSPTPSLASTLLSSDEFEDEDDFEDELSDDDRCVSVPESARYAQPAPYQQQQRYQHQQQQQQQSNDSYWQYYQPPQQTIRCDENGKSYLELGASPSIRTRCCDGRARWCHVPCYRQRRLAVLNLSMCKLARYRQCSDPSLRRSVLICNTLRRLEREMDSDPTEPCSYQSQTNLPIVEVQPVQSRLSPMMTTEQNTSNYEQSLRDMACSSSGRATPFPSNPSDADSGLGDDEMTKPINWSSVLSLSSQTDLESLNNNELYAELGLTSSESDWKDPSCSQQRSENEWDGFMHVLVGGT